MESLTDCLIENVLLYPCSPIEQYWKLCQLLEQDGLLPGFPKRPVLPPSSLNSEKIAGFDKGEVIKTSVSADIQRLQKRLRHDPDYAFELMVFCISSDLATFDERRQLFSSFSAAKRHRKLEHVVNILVHKIIMNPVGPIKEHWALCEKLKHDGFLPCFPVLPTHKIAG